MEEAIAYIETPWDCETLDPFRDDPKEDCEIDKSPVQQAVVRSTSTKDQPMCSCGENCPTMPTEMEQVCCKEVLTGSGHLNFRKLVFCPP